MAKLIDFKIKNLKSFLCLNGIIFSQKLQGPMQNCNLNNLSYYSAYNKIENISFVIFHEK